MSHQNQPGKRYSIVVGGLLVIVATLNCFAQSPFAKNEFIARRDKLLAQIPQGVAIIFAARPHSYPVKFRQSPDFYYLTGIEEPDAVLMLVGPKKKSIVFAAKKPAYKVQAEGPGLRDLSKPEELYGLTAVLPLEHFLAEFRYSIGNAKSVYLPLSFTDNLQESRKESESMEGEKAVHPLYQTVPDVKRAITLITQWAADLSVQDVNPLIDKLRWVKTPYEIERMKRSGAIAAEGVKESIKGTRPGMYEYEIEAVARFIFLLRGARGDGFSPIVASGPNILRWHYTSNNRQMQAGDIVYMDYGCDYEYYVSDVKRVWPVSGRFTSEQEKMYQCVLEAHNVIIAAMKPGLTLKDLQDKAENVYKKYGYQKEFVEDSRYIGHFVGISVHDSGSSNLAEMALLPLQAGVIFNVEPALNFPERNLHFQLEDTVLVTVNGAENMTADAPTGLEEIYSLIKQKRIGQ